MKKSEKTGLIVLGVVCLLGGAGYLALRHRSKVIDKKIEGTVTKLTEILREKNNDLEKKIDRLREGL